MRRPRCISATLCALLFWLMSGAAFAQNDAALAARLDALARGFMATEQVPGAIAAIVHGDEVILRGYGAANVAEGVAAGPDTARFEIGSITKLFTWVAVMMLVEDGQLDLQADVSTYVDDVPLPGGGPLTLAQLMSQRGGFEESYAIFDPALAALPRPEALAAAAPEQVFAHGTLTTYSNWGAALAGYIVETVSGQPWEVFVQTRILDPLRMDDTTTAERLARPGQPPLAQSYRVQNGILHPAFRIDIGAFGPAGAMASTAADMARFLRFLMGDGSLDGVRLLRAETIARMRTRLFDDRPEAADMAHGFQARPMFGTTVYGHGGGLNEFLSNIAFIPEIGAGVFISQNGGSGASLPLLVPTLLLETMAAEAGLSPPDAAPVPDAAERATEAAGRYLTNRRPFSGAAQVLAALSPISITALPDGAILVPNPVLKAVVRYEPIAPDLWQDDLGARIAVLRDETGRVIRFVDGTGAQSHERLRGLADPIWLWLAFGVTLLLSITTLAGLVWRHGVKGGSRLGTLAGSVSLMGAISVLAMAAAGVVAAVTAATLGSDYLFDQPQPTLEVFFTLGDVVAVIAAVAVLALVGVWRARGWSVARRLHQTAFTLAIATLSGFMLQWGLAFGGPV